MTVPPRSLSELADPYPVRPVEGPLDATVRVPGSKSITNRALVAAALATGRSRLDGALRADDTEAMVEVLRALGIAVRTDWDHDRIDVDGTGGRLPAPSARLECRLSGTTSRFALPLTALGPGPYVIDGAPSLRARPMGAGLDALAALGLTVEPRGEGGHLPVKVRGGPVRGGVVEVAGDVSSQFLSGLLLVAPALAGGLEVQVPGALVSRRYVELTISVMKRFGAAAARVGTNRWAIEPTGYEAADVAIEPDASAASYFFAAAAICGGTVTVEGLGRSSQQGDLAFVDELARMGARVEVGEHRTSVTGTGRLVGIDADLGELSDTAQTLAVVAVFAEGRTRLRGIGFIRAKETDRVGNVVAELRRCGIRAEEEPDGYVVHPGAPQPATVATYHDHRMAMAFALLGLRAPGIAIADPACVAKTFPGFWDVLESI